MFQFKQLLEIKTSLGENFHVMICMAVYSEMIAWEVEHRQYNEMERVPLNLIQFNEMNPQNILNSRQTYGFSPVWNVDSTSF